MSDCQLKEAVDTTPHGTSRAGAAGTAGFAMIHQAGCSADAI